MKCVGDPACPFPALADNLCRKHWEYANPVGRYADIDALTAYHKAISKANGAGAASDYRPRRDKDIIRRRKMTENEKADCIAFNNLIAEEEAKIICPQNQDLSSVLAINGLRLSIENEERE